MSEPTYDHKDEISQLVGKINIEWGDLQFYVYSIFVHLMEDNVLAAEPIFFGIRSDATQRNITASLADTVLKYTAGAEALRKDTKDLFAEIGKLGGRRNDAIHAMWIFSLPQPTPLGGSSPRLRGANVKDELVKTHEDIRATTWKLMALLKRLQAAPLASLSKDGKPPPAPRAS